MPEIAVYGKGGIGKSTISANISAVLGSQGALFLLEQIINGLRYVIH